MVFFDGQVWRRQVESEGMIKNVTGNWYWRMCEEGFLNADSGWVMGR